MGQVTKQFDSKLIANIYINKNSIEQQVDRILTQNLVTDTKNFNVWLLKAITLIDLTTLAGDDTTSNVTRLCIKAANPLPLKLTKKLGLKEKEKPRTAAVCVYPNRVTDAYNTIKRMDLTNEIHIASVATGFPSGLYGLKSRLQEIRDAVDAGATEIDVVINRSLVLMGKWNILFDEIQHMKYECRTAHLKVILGVGELGSYENVYKASIVSMMAGADFIKTSTGKEAVNATLPVGLIMCRAIRKFYLMTGEKVGLKPAGGIKTARDAVNWLVMINSELGPEWLSPQLFRIGASSLLNVIETHVNKCHEI